MNRTYRIAALVIGLGLTATAAIVRIPAPATRAAVAQEAHATEDAGTPEEHGQGEAAAEAQQYNADNQQAERPPQWRAIDDHVNATRGPEQPIPFNHRFHATDLQVPCLYCHAGTERSSSGVVPSLDICMGCHAIAGTGLPPVEELREYGRRGEPIPWKWVNKLPEFVQFSHRPHLRNHIDCAECHGPVAEMDRVYQWAPLTMGWCLECHRQPPRESDIATDHVLTRLYPPPQAPEGRQGGSFYPRAIDSRYGDSRGPIDCASCHY